MPDDRPILDQINLVSDDIADSVKFYQLLGVSIPDAGPFQARHRTAEFETDSAVDFDLDSTEFAAQWGAEDLPTGPVLGFRVKARETVDAKYAKLTAAGHHGIRAPYDAFWGARYALIRDPGGTVVGLMSDVSDAHRSSPPEPAS